MSIVELIVSWLEYVILFGCYGTTLKQEIWETQAGKEDYVKH